MESLIFFGVLLLIAVPVAAIAAFFMVLDARADIRALKATLAGLAERIAAFETGARQSESVAAPRSATVEASPIPEAAVDDATEVGRSTTEAAEPVVRDAEAVAERAVSPEADAQAVSDASSNIGEVREAEAVADAATPEPSARPTASAARAVAKGDLEERIGTKWTVWIGGAALALGLIFLVQYSIEQGWFGPAFRIGFAAFLSLAIVAAGEFLRRRDLGVAAFAGFPSAHIPAVLTAAGASGLFATVWAAHVLYGFIGTGTAFVVLGLVGVATMAAALVHGPWLGVLGILAAYGTPILVQSNAPHPAALVIFLSVVTASAFGVARLRLWRGVASVALALAGCWEIGLIDLTAVGLFEPGWAMGFAVLLFALTAGVLVASFGEAAVGPEDRPLDRFGLVLLAATSALVLGAFDVTPTTLGEVGLVATLVGLCALAWRLPAVVPAVTLAGVLALLAALVDHLDVARAFATDTLASGPDGLVLAAPAAALAWLTFHGAITALLGGFGLLGAARATPDADRSSGWFALAGVATPILMLVIAWGRVSSFESHHGFAAVALGLAVAFAVAVWQLTRRESAERPALSVAVVAVGTIAALGAGFAIALDRAALTIALALMIPAIAWVHGRRPIDVLRAAAAVVAVVVLGRLVWDPAITANIGRTPIFNALLLGYGIPALGSAYAVWAFRKGPADAWKAMLEAVAVLFAGALVLVEIRHLVNGGDLFALRFDHAELGLDVAAASIFSIALTRLQGLMTSRVAARIAAALPWLTAVVAVLGLGVIVDPFFGFYDHRASAGSLFVGYALPALTAALAARLARKAGRPRAVVTVQAMTAYGLGFVFVSLMVDWAFNGPRLGRSLGDAEMWAFSGAWLAYGVATLVAGLQLGSKPVRLLSGAVIALVAVKVFLLDLAGIGGVWRALSFLGLGAVLIGIALVYQRWIFPRDDGPRSNGARDAGGQTPPAA